ncbi:GNAT family N-acetyltransferase [Mesoplasma syrphidae]|uniref:GNAT family N-acetyltransferase n=1 Tax=Mesoplasma syrphidae TaxID=225999 RepID=A0A2K9BU65_9MOLU|nr:GNAT family N-acetyltransferase [Mesoplasma syrphidae]AUF83250.1 GNAT family N-acetyltransferase [Mesoplasma syrphidae]
MKKIVLINPTIAYEAEIKKYVEEFDNKVIEGSSQLFAMSNIKEWLQYLKNQKDAKNLPLGRVPSLEFLVVDIESTELVGLVNIRLSLTEYLLNYGGHIGYSVSPKHRRKGYGTEILKLALQEATKHGIKQVLVTCKADNIGSMKVILNNKGILEDQRYEPEQKLVFNRYWISVE